MKKNILLWISLTTLFVSSGYAQLAEEAEDIAPLLIGETLPQDIAAGMNSGKKNLAKMIGEKPSVILFYRGGWCPYCNRHMAAIGEAEKDILALGYQIIGISPDAEEELRKFSGKNKLNYTLFSDSDGRLAKAMGIAFKAPDNYRNRLIKSSGGTNEGFLPVPSVFVLDKKGEIVFEYIAPNFKERISTELLKSVLGSLEL